MKKGVWVLCLLMTLVLWCGCGKEPEPAEGAYMLYFLSGSDRGPALTGQAWQPDGEDAEPGEMLRALLGGPEEEGLRSPFPRGVAMRTCSFDPDEEGLLRVWLTEQYSGLSDISLTLADYCIVLTLSQLDGVEAVEIISGSHSVNYRSHQILSAEEAVLTDSLTGEG